MGTSAVPGSAGIMEAGNTGAGQGRRICWRSTCIERGKAMAIKSYGRADWRPILKVWSVIIYRGMKDEEVGRATTKVVAESILRAVIAERQLDK